MPLRPLPIGGGLNLDSDQSSVRDGAAVAYYNCYIDRAGAIRTFPGLTEVDDVGTDASVWNYWNERTAVRYIVSAGRIWKQTTESGTLAELTGSGLTAGTPPSFADDGSDIYVAANSAIYKIGSSSLTALAGNAPTAVTSLLWTGGYLMANGPDVPGDTVYSDDKINTYALWEVYNNESNPDRLQTLMLIGGQFVYNIGPQTLEVTYASGDPANPWALNRGRISNLGTLAKYSVCYDGETCFYLSEVTQSRKIVANKDGQISLISMPMELPFEKFERLDDALGMIVSCKAQNWYVLYFPTVNTIINEQYMDSLTLGYHIQKQEWTILSKWTPATSEWGAWRGVSYCYIEPWNVRLVGGRDGKTYRFYENDVIDYTGVREFRHRWRDDSSKAWRTPRIVSLGVAGQYNIPPDQNQCGSYKTRQHEISYSDLTDAGETFRMMILSGDINHGVSSTKRANYYHYSVKKGTNEFIVNAINEDVIPYGR